MLILDNTIKQVIKELICEYWDDDAVISNTRMDELTRRCVTDESWGFFLCIWKTCRSEKYMIFKDTILRTKPEI